MAFVAAKCTQCNAALEVDPSKDAAICPYCGTAFITEKAIHHHHTTNVTNIGTLHADKVQLGDSAEDELRAAETLLKLNNRMGAGVRFANVCEKHPYDYRGWFGRVRVISEELTRMDLTQARVDEMRKYYQSAFTVASEEEKALFVPAYRDYYKRLLEQAEVRRQELTAKKNALLEQNRAEIAQTEAELSRLKANHPAMYGDNLMILLSLAGLVYTVFSFVKEGVGSGILTAVVLLFGLGLLAALAEPINKITGCTKRKEAHALAIKQGQAKLEELNKAEHSSSSSLGEIERTLKSLPIPKY